MHTAFKARTCMNFGFSIAVCPGFAVRATAGDGDGPLLHDDCGRAIPALTSGTSVVRDAGSHSQVF